MIHYRIFSERMCGEALGEFITYGIIAASEKGELRAVHDISCERKKVEALAALFNAERLEPEHLDEAVENFLYTLEV